MFVRHNFSKFIPVLVRTAELVLYSYLQPPTPCPAHCLPPNISLYVSVRTLRTVHAIAILPRRQEPRHAMMRRMRRASLCRLLTRAALRTSAAGIAATSILPVPKERTQGALGSYVPTAEFHERDFEFEISRFPAFAAFLQKAGFLRGQLALSPRAPYTMVVADVATPAPSWDGRYRGQLRERRTAGSARGHQTWRACPHQRDYRGIT